MPIMALLLKMDARLSNIETGTESTDSKVNVLGNKIDNMEKGNKK